MTMPFVTEDVGEIQHPILRHIAPIEQSAILHTMRDEDRQCIVDLTAAINRLAAVIERVTPAAPNPPDQSA